LRYNNLEGNNETYYSKIYDPKSKTVVQTDSRSFYYESIRSRGEFIKRVLLDEPLSEYSCGTRFSTNDKFYETFSRKIQQLIEAGIVQNIVDKKKKFLDPKYYEKPIMIHKEYLETTYANSFENGPSVLTMDTLEFGS
jgi:hypothetical protein